MRITVTRSGGFAGMTRHAQVEVAGRADADDWYALLRRVDLADLPSRSSRHPDRFVYTIDIDGKAVAISEADLSGALRELVDRVIAEA